MISTSAQELVVTYRPRGAAKEIFGLRVPELVLCGPAGTGKSRAALEKVHLACLKHPSLRALMVRKTRRSLTESGMVTFAQKVIHPSDGVIWRGSDQQYQYRNGSIVAVGGLDKPSKVMSSEWDIIYVQEATELEENDWEALTTRLRNNKNSYQQLLGDVNPGPTTHWLKRRADQGKTLMLESRHEDNPLLFTDDGNITQEGERYLAVLDALSGVRYLRLRLGQWASAEGMVYQESWDRSRNLIDRAPINIAWPRYITVDFGYTNAFVCQWWAEDPDGRLILYREIYQTRTLVEDHAKTILAAMGYEIQGGSLKRKNNNAEPLPRAIICDHDAEDRATLEKHIGMSTIAANKAVSSGIQAVASRLRPAGDGKPRLQLMRDVLVRRDPLLSEAKKPTCTVEEIESYVWDTSAGKQKGEAPLKKDDHGVDCMRYICAYKDVVDGSVSYWKNIWE